MAIPNTNISSEIGRRGLQHGSAAQNLADSDDIDFRHLIDLLISGKWIVLAVTLIVGFGAAVYAFTSPPIYQSSGLVEVEQDQQSKTSADLGALSSLFLGAPMQTEAEIQILSSRLVLGQVVDRMNLTVSAEPRLFPVIGGAYYRRHQAAAEPLSVPSFLRKYAWGGESIDVPTFDVPAGALDRQFVLKVTASGFELVDEDGQKLLAGEAGQRGSVPFMDGTMSIFVRELKARPGTEFLLTKYSLLNITKRLSSALTIAEQGKQSGIISVTFKGRSPDFVSKVVNNIEDAYLLQNVEQHSAEAKHSLDFLEKQAPQIKETVETAQANLNSYQLKHGSVDVAKETEIVLQSSVDLETSRLQLENDRAEALQRFMPDHPFVKSIDEKLRSVATEQEKLKGRTNTLPTTQQEILSLMRDLDVYNQLYTTTLNSIQQLQMAKAGTVGSVRIVDYALAPKLALSPQKRVIVLVGLVLGFIAGSGYVLVQRMLLRGVDDPTQIETRLGLAAYAEIPYSPEQSKIRGRTTGVEGGQNLLATASSSDIAVEALRSLRNSLHFLLLESSNNVVMLTGPTPGVGKSFVSSNLAALLAISGKRTVVVDADLRLGQLHQHVGLAASPGLSEYIAGKAEESEVVRPISAIPNLMMVTNGVKPPNPAELLLHERFAKLVESLSKQFDFVIIDTPPSLLVADAAVVGNLAGCSLLVLKSAEHPMREIEEAYRRLLQAGVNVRGVIFNQMGRRLGSYGYGGYGYSYKRDYKYDQ